MWKVLHFPSGIVKGLGYYCEKCHPLPVVLSKALVIIVKIIALSQWYYQQPGSLLWKVLSSPSGIINSLGYYCEKCQHLSVVLLTILAIIVKLLPSPSGIIKSFGELLWKVSLSSDGIINSLGHHWGVVTVQQNIIISNLMTLNIRNWNINI